ncbi:MULTISPECIES: catalase [unclassified Paenibacillus]|uniref:catalase n=1 Tax=unclassified Paenibacillus TaxID=185978 RepID=UPI001AE98AC6|nr:MULTISPECIES: catalase [unclassified Paenibacillus]MBP1153430.1 catalase [Paenibacillus sp. PvP091]MBP1171187.1 catalase [Paenibacillus sp. PvR098]MBP2442215.1 catalase [Paenibacillus sp. PvP052]
MNNKLTTNQGAPVGDNQNSRTAGQRGPALLDDYHLLEKLAHFDRERIPERVVHARGAGAHGVFRTEASMKPYTKAHFLQEAGKETPVLVRFSTVIHGTGSPETARDPRGFSVKFYTEEGNYDLVGNHLPVFFIRDAIKFPDMVHSLKPAPDKNIQDPARYWDFMTLSPESTHMMTWVFSDNGTPANYRQMDGFGVHAFKWVNAEGKVVYVKYQWKSLQGVVNLSADEAREVQGGDFNHATRDLFDNIEKGNFPQWELYVQMMPVEHVDRFAFDPLDPTKVWPEDMYPLNKVGTMTLNQNPQNYFAEVEQSAFAPSVLVPGIEPSEDKLLQGRLFSYPDTQRYRLGANYLQIPVNCPYAPVRNHQRDGLMNVKQDPSPVNYEPNSFEESPKEAPEYVESRSPLHGEAGRQRIDKTDDFTQAGERYRSFSEQERDHLISNLVNDLKQTDENIQLRAVCNFFRADREYGMRLAQGLGIDISGFIPKN